MNKEYYNCLDTDTILLLESLELKEGHLCKDIMCLYINSTNISEICRTLNVSRFIVNKMIDTGKKHIRKIVEEEII